MSIKKIIRIIIGIVAVLALVWIICSIVLNSTWNNVGDEINNMWGDTETTE